MKSTRSATIVVTVCLALALVATACGSDDSSSSVDEVPAGRGSTTAPPPSQPESTGVETTSASTSPTDQGSAPSTTAPSLANTVSAAEARVEFVEFANFEQPLDIDWHPNGSGPFVATKTGTLFDATDGADRVVLDLSDRVATNSERGLLSVEFSPDGSHLYAHWSDLDGTNVLSAWAWLDGAPLSSDDGVEIMRITQPYSNHNGGGMAFGPDGYLYWGQGDGGSGGDPEDNGQDRSSLLGAVLRIDPDPVDGGYAVPPDNPFADSTEGEPEIWIYGLRNPWRMSFDPATGDLWIGDVGQNAFEEIDRVGHDDAGANLGWNCYEGFEAFAGCDIDQHHEPVVVYDRDLGQSVTGGVFFQGSIDGLIGHYVFGDYASGRIWALAPGSNTAEQVDLNLGGVVGFASAPDGTLWMASITQGTVGYLQ